MERHPLKSTAVLSAGYDPASGELEIEFRGGRIYRYQAVPPAVVAWLHRTPNKGGYVARVIDAQYRSVEITPPPVEQDLLAALQRSLRPD